MTTEQPKSPSTSEQPTVFPGPPPQHFIGGAIPPPPPGYPPFFTFPPPAEGQQPDSNGSAAPPYPLMYPPGMVYAFPPAPPAASAPTGTPRPKRKQVKMACTNCAAASKRCDEARPCERCRKYGVADTCVDGQRKERKKGVKRGPYKRKNKQLQTVESAYGEIPPPPEGGEWPQGAPPPNAPGAAAIYAVAQFPPPEGYYPIFYPPPGAYPLPEGQTNADGSQTNGQPPPPIMPFYIPGFPPFPYPPPPGTVFQFPPPVASAHPPPSVSQLASGATESEPGQKPEKKDEEATCVNPAELSDNGTTTSHSQVDDGVDAVKNGSNEGHQNLDDGVGSQS